ncbi:hypothetical protein [Bradyrhizobium sp. th.b2]|uniref:hypothetical protein n=1 Tax=Bradyrhizobium sp. th-b2 TaxID=172088 RepID=UPI001FD98FF3|nr:hypothetical protein [Bradyrhizobium sp. th.b2]
MDRQQQDDVNTGSPAVILRLEISPRIVPRPIAVADHASRTSRKACRSWSSWSLKALLGFYILRNTTAAPQSIQLRQINTGLLHQWQRGHQGINPREGAMPSFDVRFIKTVCDDTGHEHRACQATFKVDAASLSVAAQLAQADFCRQKGIRDWTIFADSMELRMPSSLPSAWGS